MWNRQQILEGQFLILVLESMHQSLSRWKREKWAQSHALWEDTVLQYHLLTAKPKSGVSAKRFQRNQEQGALVDTDGAKNTFIPGRRYLSDFSVITVIAPYIWYRQLELSVHPKQEAAGRKTTSSCLKSSRPSQHQLCNCSLSPVPRVASLVCKRGPLWGYHSKGWKLKLLAKGAPHKNDPHTCLTSHHTHK